MRNFLLLLIFLGAFVAPAISPAEDEKSDLVPVESGLTLGSAEVCESVKDGAPRNAAVAFSVSLGRVYGLTDFVSVGEKTYIYHNWYFRDIKKASVKLVLRPPRWTTYSSIQLRSSDTGPWRLEIADAQGKLLNTIRFSVID